MLTCHGPVWLCFQAALSSQAATQANACLLLAFSSFFYAAGRRPIWPYAYANRSSNWNPRHMSPIYPMDNTWFMVACTGHGRTAAKCLRTDRSRAHAAGSSRDLAAVFVVGLVSSDLRRGVSHPMPIRPAAAPIASWSDLPTGRHGRGGRPETGRPAMRHGSELTLKKSLASGQATRISSSDN